MNIECSNCGEVNVAAIELAEALQNLICNWCEWRIGDVEDYPVINCDACKAARAALARVTQ